MVAWDRIELPTRGFSVTFYIDSKWFDIAIYCIFIMFGGHIWSQLFRNIDTIIDTL
jgi:hypothetical protein